MECERLPAPRTWDQATPEDLKNYRLHVRYCGSCRARVLSEAPDQLLFDLQCDPLPQDFWLGFWNSVHQKRSIAGGSLVERTQRALPFIIQSGGRQYLWLDS